MHNLNDLFYFVQVAEHGGFSSAARALGEPKSKLSRRIAQLESRLGVQLIKRSTRQFSVTGIGQVYYDHCKAMLVEADAAQEAIDLTRSEPNGIVRVTCPVSLLTVTVNPILTAFMLRYPRVELHLEATDRRVDLISEDIDVALRVRSTPLEDSDLAMRTLGVARQSLIASPELITQIDLPQIPGDLQALPSLGLGQPQQEFQWRLNGPDGAEASIPHQPRFITCNMTALGSAALSGVGIASLPEVIVRDKVESGELTRLLPAWEPHAETVYAMFTSRRGMLPSVRSLIDFLADEFRKLSEYRPV